MRTLHAPLIALAVVASLSACGQRDATPTAQSVPPTSQATVPPPPGDSTPKAADSGTRNAVEANEKNTTAPGSQATVGSAAAGAPPYTLGSAPEGNQTPSQGTKGAEPAKK